MAKFGLFKSGDSSPIREFEGDSMEMEKEFVKVHKSGSIDLGTYDPTHPLGKQVFAARLEQGQYVMEISDVHQNEG
jgi:hypothetical protein